MRKKIKALFVSQNRGGFNSIFPVLDELIREDNKVEILLANESIKPAKNNKLDFIDGSKMSDEDLSRYLNSLDIDIVVLGTSRGFSLDKRVIILARKIHISTVAVIDYWTDYKDRFSNPATEDMAYLPNHICVIDDNMRMAMESEGFKKNILHVTGNPFFNTFKKYSIGDVKNYAVFVSQPFSEVEYKSKLNEISIFNDYVKAFEELDIDTPIVVALHPSCKNKNKYNEIIRNSKLNISVAKKGTMDIVKEAKFVIGIRSIVLLEAVFMRKRVLSYQPDLQDEDILISNKTGLSFSVYHYDDMKKKLSNIMHNNNCDIEDILKKYVYEDAIGKVIKVIKCQTKNKK